MRDKVSDIERQKLIELVESLTENEVSALIDVLNLISNASINTGTSIRELELFVQETLIKLNVPMYMRGFDYIKIAIVHLVSTNAIGIITLGQLYEIIAENYDTAPSNIERSIRYAITHMCDHSGSSSKTLLNQIIGYNQSRQRVINSEFIIGLAVYVKSQL